VTKRVTASKYEGDDAYSWAIFIDNRPFVTGLGRSETSHYRSKAHEEVAKRMGITV
jgi:hypothetical protein